MQLRALGLCLMAALPFTASAERTDPARDPQAADQVPAQSVEPEAASRIAALTELLQVPAILDVMRQEGNSYGTSLEDDMFPGEGGGPWSASVAMIYDVERTKAQFDLAFAAALKDDPGAVAAGVAFFGSDLGKRIVGLEVSTRRAMLEPAAEDAAAAAFSSLKRQASPRILALERFAQANDLIESNVMGALNSSLAFYQGLFDGGGLDDGLTAQDMVAQVWDQETAMRSETTEWLYPYMAMAYQPLSDAEFADYIAFSETPVGKKLNAALFQAFEAVYTDVSRNLGLAVARQLQGEDI